MGQFSLENNARFLIATRAMDFGLCKPLSPITGELLNLLNPECHLRSPIYWTCRCIHESAVLPLSFVCLAVPSQSLPHALRI